MRLLAGRGKELERVPSTDGRVGEEVAGSEGVPVGLRLGQE
jgi:hypothetical protein